MNPTTTIPAPVAGNRPIPRPVRRRGAVYVLVMGASMLVAVIGVSAVMAARIERRAAADEATAVRARFAAQSYVEIVLNRLSTNTTWRSTYLHDTWSDSETIDDATLHFKLADEADSDLANSSADPFRIYARAAIGDITRVFSFAVHPPPSGSGGPAVNLLANGNMEAGALSTTAPSGWFHYPAGPAEWTTIGGRSGAGYCGRVYDRVAATSGLCQYLPLSRIKNGTSYRVEAYVKYPVNGTIYLRFYFTGDGSTSTTSIGRSVSANIWTRITGTVSAPSWSTPILSARMSVESSSGTSEIRVDDAVFAEAQPKQVFSIVSGSMRQEMQ